MPNMAKHFALLLITLALVTAGPLARILERLDTLEAQLKNATQGVQLFADGRTECPGGWIEAKHLNGRLLTTTPLNGKSGTTINRPFDAGEE